MADRLILRSRSERRARCVHALPLILRFFLACPGMPCHAMRAPAYAPLRVRGRPAGGRTVSEPAREGGARTAAPSGGARPGQAPACALTPPLAASRWSTSIYGRERPASTGLAFFSSSVRWPVSLVSFDVVWKQVKLSQRAGPCRSTGRQLLALVRAWRLTACTKIMQQHLLNRSNQWSLNLTQLN